jgi:ribosome biogenesis GTPase
LLDEEKAIKERWTREGRNPKLKKQKEISVEFSEVQHRVGMVVEVHRRSSLIRLADNCHIKARYSPLLKSHKEFPAVGDWVNLSDEIPNEDTWILRVQPRSSKLSRPGPKDRIHHELILAANIDQVVIVSSLREPEFNVRFADRFLIASELSRLDFILVLNKCDLTSDYKKDAGEIIHLAKTIAVSAKTGEGLDELRNLLKGKLSVFSGQSGVGKSTLIQSLIPGLDLRTTEVRPSDGKGRHTTTSSSLFDLPGGGSVIDTPGIRGLGFWDMPRLDLAMIFPGFQAWVGTCQFNNCLHLQEPGCSIIRALEDGSLSEARYQSYLRILASID